MGSIAQDVPPELKEWMKLFEKATYRHDYTRFFDDFLTICISCFAFQTMEEEYLYVVKQYKKEDLELLGALFGEFVLVMNKMVDPKHNTDFYVPEHCPRAVPWYDALGTIYEVISGHGKRKGMGQFFTPPTIVNFMSQMMDPQGEETMLEPASGSGRFVIAAHCNNPGPGIKIAVDADSMCAKMTAINMFMHGVKGEAICDDSLMLSYNFGYVTNPYFGRMGIFKLPEEKSLYVRGNKARAAEVAAGRKEVEKKAGLEDTLFAEGIDTKVVNSDTKRTKSVPIKPKSVTESPISSPTLF